MEKLTITVAEMAEHLNISLPTAYDLVHRTDFPAIHVGARWIIPVDALRRWLDFQAVGAQPE